MIEFKIKNSDDVKNVLREVAKSYDNSINFRNILSKSVKFQYSRIVTVYFEFCGEKYGIRLDYGILYKDNPENKKGVDLLQIIFTRKSDNKSKEAEIELSTIDSLKDFIVAEVNEALDYYLNNLLENDDFIVKIDRVGD